MRERVGWVVDACKALAQLHSHTRTAGNPTVHWDVTPANCILTLNRRLVLIDVSTMQLSGDGVDLAGRHTLACSAPEVLAMPHNPRRPSVDLYAIGALASSCLTGQEPATADRWLDGIARGPAAVRRATLRARAANRQARAGDGGRDPQARPHDLLAWGRELGELAAPRRAVLASRIARRPAVAVPLVLFLAAVGTLTGMLFSGHGLARDQAGTRAAQASARQSVPASLGISKTSFSTPEGSITSPAPGDRVRDCEYLTGAVRLGPGFTVMLSEHNFQRRRRHSLPRGRLRIRQADRTASLTLEELPPMSTTGLWI